MMTEILGELSL